MHKKLGEKCRSKANYVVWQVGLISRYFTRTTTDLPAHACSRHVPCDQLDFYLFGYGIQSKLHLMNSKVFKSQSPNVSASCHDAFVDWNQREYNNDNHICQTHPTWRVSQKSGNLGIRKGEPPVERQRVKAILQAFPACLCSQPGSTVSRLNVGFHKLPRLWSHRNAALKVCEINI